MQITPVANTDSKCMALPALGKGVHHITRVFYAWEKDETVAVTSNGYRIYVNAFDKTGLMGIKLPEGKYKKCYEGKMLGEYFYSTKNDSKREAANNICQETGNNNINNFMNLLVLRVILQWIGTLEFYSLYS